jgi:hypothetical protein
LRGGSPAAVGWDNYLKGGTLKAGGVNPPHDDNSTIKGRMGYFDLGGNESSGGTIYHQAYLSGSIPGDVLNVLGSATDKETKDRFVSVDFICCCLKRPDMCKHHHGF